MCTRCDQYLAEQEERIHRLVHGDGTTKANKREQSYTVAGKLIAAGARAKGLEVREVSARIGRAPDYLGRVCRGELVLNTITARAVGVELGVDLMPYVGVAAPPVEPPVQQGLLGVAS